MPIPSNGRTPQRAYLVVHAGPIKLGDRVTAHEIFLPDMRDEAYQAAARRERFRREEAARIQRYAAGYSAMLQADDSARVVLELHAPHERWPGHGDDLICKGCDAEGFEVDDTSWPCSTVDALADLHGHDMTYFGHEHGGNGARV